MTKGSLIGSVLLRLSGGRPTSDMSVREHDVRSLIAPAINLSMEMGDNMNRDQDQDRDYLTEFYGNHPSIAINRTSSTPYITLANSTVPLKGNNGLRLVYDNCGHYYGKLMDADRATISYYSKITHGIFWYYRLGDKLLLYGINPLIETISYDALTNIDDLADDAELPLVAGTESKAIETLFGLVTGQIQNPYDSKIDKDDINKS